MSGYRRFIAYVYEYQKGKKGGNCGFIKVEVRDRRCRVELHLHCIGLPPKVECRTYGFLRKDGLMNGILLGSCESEADTVECVFETDAMNMAGSGIPFGKIGGIVLLTQSGGFFGTEWDDQPVKPDNFREMKTEQLSHIEASTGNSMKNQTPAAGTADAATAMAGKNAEAVPAMEGAAETPSGGNADAAPNIMTNVGQKLSGSNAVSISNMAAGAANMPSGGITDSMSNIAAGAANMPPGGNAVSMSNMTAGAAKTPSGGNADSMSNMKASAAKTPSGSKAATGASGGSVAEIRESVPADAMTMESVTEPVPKSGNSEANGGNQITADSGSDISKEHSADIVPSANADNAADSVPNMEADVEAAAQDISSAPADAKPKSDGDSAAQFTSPATNTADSTTPASSASTDIPAEADKKTAPAVTEITAKALPESVNSATTSTPAAQPELTASGATSSGASATAPRADSMPRQAPSIAVPGEEFMPFDDVEFMKCWKIHPNDLARFPSRARTLRNNRFLQYGYYNFGHLLLAKRANGRFVLGVPGGYDQQERFMANMFGFPYFKECRLIELPRNRGGYWYRLIDTPDFH